MQLAAFQPFADFRNRPRGVVMVGEVDLDVILRSGAPRTFLRKRMARAGDDAPAGAGKADHGGMADAAAGAGQKQRAPWRVGGSRHGDSFRLFGSGIKPRFGPWLIRRRATEFDAVVQAERAVVPELELHRRDAPAAPAGRARHRADEVFGGERSNRLFERKAAFQG